MFGNTRSFRICIALFVLIGPAAVLTVYAQDKELADIKYKEDYDRIQSITKIGDIAKRADKMVALYSEERDMDSKLRDYADSLFARDLETMNKQGNLSALKSICERILKVRPKFGEVYLFYGVALKNEKKMDEALNAFARGSAIPNQLQAKAKQQLDLAYRAAHGGSLVGQDKFVKEAMKDLK